MWSRDVIEELGAVEFHIDIALRGGSGAGGWGGGGEGGG